jgi:hypothetical protein
LFRPVLAHHRLTSPHQAHVGLAGPEMLLLPACVSACLPASAGSKSCWSASHEVLGGPESFCDVFQSIAIVVVDLHGIYSGRRNRFVAALLQELVPLSSLAAPRQLVLRSNTPRHPAGPPLLRSTLLALGGGAPWEGGEADRRCSTSAARQRPRLVTP